jgi:hypothetical protein
MMIVKKSKVVLVDISTTFAKGNSSQNIWSSHKYIHYFPPLDMKWW